MRNYSFSQEKEIKRAKKLSLKERQTYFAMLAAKWKRTPIGVMHKFRNLTKPSKKKRRHHTVKHVFLNEPVNLKKEITVSYKEMNINTQDKTITFLI